MNNVLLIDTTGIIHRLWMMNGKMSFPTDDFMDNVTSFIERQRKVHRPTHTICAFDDCEGSWRSELDTNYVYHGGSLPTPYIQFQSDLIEKLDNQGIKEVILTPNNEGFDALSHIANKLKNIKNTQVRIISSDKRFLHQVETDFMVFMPLSRYPEDRKKNSEWLELKFSIKPNQMTDYLMLVGDKSHENKGIKGVGPKKAVMLLEKYGSLSEVLINSAAIEGNVGKILRSITDDEFMTLSKIFNTNDEINLSVSLRQFRDFEYQPDMQKEKSKSM